MWLYSEIFDRAPAFRSIISDKIDGEIQLKPYLSGAFRYFSM